MEPRVREALMDAEANMFHLVLTGRISLQVYKKWLKATEKKLAER